MLLSNNMEHKMRDYYILGSLGSAAGILFYLILTNQVEVDTSNITCTLQIRKMRQSALVSLPEAT